MPALYRAMPNLLYIRPCDSEKVAGAFCAALEATHTPTIISLSRHASVFLPFNHGNTGKSVMQYSREKLVLVIEAFSVTGWERYADAGLTMSSFGKSLPGAEVYKFFQFDGQTIARKVEHLFRQVEREGIAFLRGDFQDLNGILAVESR